MPQVPLDLLASCERGHVCDIKKRWADWLGYLAAGANGAAGKHAILPVSSPNVHRF